MVETEQFTHAEMSCFWPFGRPLPSLAFALRAVFPLSLPGVDGLESLHHSCAIFIPEKYVDPEIPNDSTRSPAFTYSLELCVISHNRASLPAVFCRAYRAGPGLSLWSADCSCHRAPIFERLPSHYLPLRSSLFQRPQPQQ